MSFPNYLQPDSLDCGPACIRIICNYYGKDIDIQRLRDLSETTREGTSLASLCNCAEKIGFRTIGAKISYNSLLEERPFPLVAFMSRGHYVVVYKIRANKVYVSDPSFGLIKYEAKEFISNWIGANATESTNEGLVLLLEPSPEFTKHGPGLADPKESSFFVLKYTEPYRKLFLQVFFGLIISSLIQLLFPFITQSIVDHGIKVRDLSFIHLLLFGQIMLFAGQIVIEIVRNWTLLHLSSRINIALVSDFFTKLMNLPISYFDSRVVGDIVQRINDHQKVEQLITSSSITTIFSIFNVVLFSGVLLYYDYSIFVVYLLASGAYVGWMLVFMRRRRRLNYRQFSQLANEQNKVLEIIYGMQEIKLNNSERRKRWEWEHLQAKLFRLSVSTLRMNQFQTVGSSIVLQLLAITITYMSASSVIKGDISLGMMLSIQYIVGQINSPLVQLVTFAQSVQDAKISIERLETIHKQANEEDPSVTLNQNIDTSKGLVLRNVFFRYRGSDRYALEGLNFSIPPNKITAIVGHSGCGKSTLLKLLLKFYEPDSGVIAVGDTELGKISHKAWRSSAGAVMQEGYIFNDSIAGNISIGIEGAVEFERMRKAAELANISEFIESLPLGYNSKIGENGVGLSTGQKQRIQIARVIYKSPKFIFFDEATSSLDSNNERIIIENINKFLRGRTAVIIAHRLSTVKHADQIIVMDEGKIVETGTHVQLLSNRGLYYDLVKNQLELEVINGMAENSHHSKQFIP